MTWIAELVSEAGLALPWDNIVVLVLLWHCGPFRDGGNGLLFHAGRHTCFDSELAPLGSPRFVVRQSTWYSSLMSSPSRMSNVDASGFEEPQGAESSPWKARVQIHCY